MRTVLLSLVFAWSGPAMAADFEAANRFLRDGAIQYGNANLDPATHLVRQAHGRLLVMGSGPDADQIWTNVTQAAKELGSTIELLRVTDEQDIAQYGVPNTPAVLSIRERVKSVARVPSVEVVKEWIKELRG